MASSRFENKSAYSIQVLVTTPLRLTCNTNYHNLHSATPAARRPDTDHPRTRTKVRHCHSPPPSSLRRGSWGPWSCRPQRRRRSAARGQSFCARGRSSAARRWDPVYRLRGDAMQDRKVLSGLTRVQPTGRARQDSRENTSSSARER